MTKIEKLLQLISQTELTIQHDFDNIDGVTGILKGDMHLAHVSRVRGYDVICFNSGVIGVKKIKDMMQEFNQSFKLNENADFILILPEVEENEMYQSIVKYLVD